MGIAALDLAEIAVDIHVFMRHLKDTSCDVGAVVRHSFKSSDQVGEDKAKLDGAFLSSKTINVLSLGKVS